jgi:hypothetical protein
MRRSGEAERIEDDGDPEGKRQSAEPGADQTRAAGTAARAYPVWLKIEPAKRKLAPVPQHLSRQTWARLSRQIAAFLRSRLNNNLTLRDAVRVVDAEMRLGGATHDEVAAALRAAVAEHPELATLDRTNVVTRRLASEELVDRMLGWLEG